MRATKKINRKMRPLFMATLLLWVWLPAHASHVNFTVKSLFFGSVAPGQNQMLSYTVSSSELGFIEVAAPAGYAVSSNPTGGFGSQLLLPPGGGSVFVRFSPEGSNVYAGTLTHTVGGQVTYLRVAGAGSTGEPRVVVQGQTLEFDETYFEGPYAWQAYLIYGFDLDGPISVRGFEGFEIRASAHDHWATTVAGDSVVVNKVGNDVPFTTILARSLQRRYTEDAGYIGHYSKGAQVELLGLTARVDGTLPLAQFEVPQDSIHFDSTKVDTEVVRPYRIDVGDLTNNYICLDAPEGFTLSVTGEADDFAEQVCLAHWQLEKDRAYVWVKFNPTAKRAYQGWITHSSQNVNTKLLKVRGAGTDYVPKGEEVPDPGIINREELDSLGYWVWPNPTADEAHVAFPEDGGIFEVIDRLGRVVYQETPGNPERRSVVNMRSLDGGIYIFRYRNSRGNTFVRRVIKY